MGPPTLRLLPFLGGFTLLLSLISLPLSSVVFCDENVNNQVVSDSREISFSNSIGWQRITSHWPSQNAFSSESDHRFIFDGDSGRRSNGQPSIGFTETFISEMKKQMSGRSLEVSFQIWIARKEDTSSTESPVLTLVAPEVPLRENNLVAKYKAGGFEGAWMPVLVRINGDDLGSFKLNWRADDLFVAIRAFQVKYSTFTSADPLNPSQIPLNPKNSTQRILQIPPSILSLDQLCIDLTYALPDAQSADLKVVYALGVNGNQTNALLRQTITQLRLNGNSAGRANDLTLCLAHYLAFTVPSAESLVFLEIAEPQGLNLTSKLTRRTGQPPAPIDFLLPFGGNASLKAPNSALTQLESLHGEMTFDELWHRQWNEDGLQFEDFFTLTPGGIVFTANYPQITGSTVVHLSSRWISRIGGIFKYQLKNPSENLFERLKIHPRICNALGQCSDVVPNLVTPSSVTPNQLEYSFKLPEIHTQLFRLEFEFEIPRKLAVNESLSVELSLVDTAHPCYEFNGNMIVVKSGICLNRGFCLANESAKNARVCVCPSGYSGETCTETDPCLVKVDGAKETGFEACSKQGLACLATNQKAYNCVCANQPDSRVSWNASSKICQTKRPESKAAFPVPLNESIVYHFTQKDDLLPVGYDLCFDLLYSLKLIQKEESLEKRPLIAVKLNEILLFRHRLSLQDPSERIKFCLEDFILVKNLLKNQGMSSFDVKFSLETVQNATEFEATYTGSLRSISLTMEPLKIGSQEIPEKTKEYNQFFESNLQFKRWKFDGFALNQSVELEEKERKLKIHNPGSKPLFATLTSDWFLSNGALFSGETPLSLAWLNCGDISIQNLAILYSSPVNHQLKRLNLPLIKNELSQLFLLKQSDALKELSQSSGTPFKMTFELSSSCDLAELRLQMEIEKICGKDKNACGSESDCRANYRDGSFGCECKKSGHFGENCEKVDPCMTQKICETVPVPVPNQSKVPAGSCVSLKLAEPQHKENGTFACSCWHGVFGWDPKSQSCNPLFHKIEENLSLEPHGPRAFLGSVISPNSNVTATVDGNSLKWMDRPAYWTARHTLPTPFYLALSPGLLEFDTKWPGLLEPKKDVCLMVDYFLAGNGTEIGLSSVSGTSKSSSLAISQATGTTRGVPSSSKTKICLRTLMSAENLGKELNSVEFKIATEYSSQDKEQLTAIRVYDAKEVDQIVDLDRLNSSFIEAAKRNLVHSFLLPLPSEVWTVSEREIKFSSPENTGSVGPKVSYLLSAWFSAKNRRDHVLRFKVKQSSKTKTETILKVVAFNENMDEVTEEIVNEWDINLIASVNRTDVVFDTSELTGSLYRFGFKVELPSGSTEEAFSIEDLDFDDFCQLTIDETVGDSICSGRGSCTVAPGINDRGYTCSCNQGFEGNDCQTINFCKLMVNVTLAGASRLLDGDQICAQFGGGKCVNEREKFTCDCSGDDAKIWTMDGFNKPHCKLLSVCLTGSPCPTGTLCREVTEGKADCSRCAPGYRKLGPASTTSACIKEDPCGQGACPGRNTQCYPVWNLKNDGPVTGEAFCSCKHGYVKDSGTLLNCRKSSVCDFAFFNPCDQKCEPLSGSKFKCTCYDPVNFTWDRKTKKCLPKTTPTCQPACTALDSYCSIEKSGPGACKCSKTGFNYKVAFIPAKPGVNGSVPVDACVPEEGANFPECPNGKMGNDPKTGKAHCVCEGQYVTVPETGICKLKAICGQGGDGFKECRTQKALCLLTDNLSSTTKNGSKSGIESFFKCACPPGQHWIVSGTGTSRICGNLCDDPLIRQGCARRNAICNPLSSEQLTESFNGTDANWSRLCRCLEGYRNYGNSFSCTLPPAPTPSLIFNLQLSFAKKTYSILRRFQEQVYRALYEVQLTNSAFLRQQRSEMTEINFGQLLADYLNSTTVNREMVQQQVKRLEILKGRPFLDRGLEQMSGQYFTVMDGLISRIRTLQCTDSGMIIEENEFVDCTVEIAVRNGTEALERLKVKPGKAKNPGKNENQKLEDYFQEEFSVNCKGSGDTCTISIDSDAKKGKFLMGVAEDDQDSSEPKDSGNQEAISLLLAQDSVENLNIQEFDFCKTAGNSCPAKTECRRPEGASSYECDCKFDTGNSVYFVEKVASGRMPDGALVHGCKWRNESEICNAYARNESASWYHLEACEVMEKNGTEIVTVHYNCTSEGWSVANETVHDGFVHVLNYCVDKYDHFCGSVDCTGSHGNCTVVNDGAQCQCSDKWKGARCELEKKKIEWLLIALIICGSVLAFVILVNLAILISKYCCGRKKKTQGGGRVSRHSTSLYLNRASESRADEMEMNHYEMNGTYRRRNESPKVPVLPPRFTTVLSVDGSQAADAQDGRRTRRRGAVIGSREDEERQQRAPATVSKSRATSKSKSKERETTRGKSSGRTSSSTKGPALAYTITSRQLSTGSDSSSASSSIDLPPSRPPSPIPQAIPGSSSGSASSSISETAKTPVILTRSMLLNSGQNTASKTTSFQYIPASLPSDETEAQAEEPRASTSKAPFSMVNPAVAALQKATKEMLAPGDEPEARPQKRRSSRHRE